jgi:hypothetical protein
MPERFPPRQVFIAHESPDAHFGGKVGGAAAVALHQSTELHRMGRHIKIIGPQNGGPSRLTIPNSLFHLPEAVGNDELLEKLTSDEWINTWQQTLNSEGEECDIYAHYFVAGAIMNKLGSSIEGRKIFMGHSWDRSVQKMDPDRHITIVRNAAEIAILNNSDMIITSTDAERRSIAKLYGSDIAGGEQAILDKISVVPLGVDSLVFSKDNLQRKRKEFREKILPNELQNSLVFYMVGRIAEQKNQLTSIAAFADVARDTSLDISLSLFGGPLENNLYYNQINEFIQTLPKHIQRKIIFHGVVDAEVAHAVGDVFLGPSTWETFFLAAAEAMYSGKPTILSDKPILREVGKDGSLYVDETDIATISTAIHSMATQPNFRRYSAAENTAVATSNYTWTKSATELDHAWRQLRQ